MIHVCFALYDKSGTFCKFTGTTMLSLFDNTKSEVTVHILHDNTLTQENRDKFLSLAERYSQTVKFYNVEVLCADRIEEIIQAFPKVEKTRFTIATFYRFFIPNVLPTNIEKIIYLDSDLIVNLDINELWQIDLNERVLGVIPISSQKLNKAPEDGFNAGVLLMNIKFFRDEDETIRNNIKFFLQNNECNLLDQDILNYYFAKDALKLPIKFNRLVKWARHYEMLQVEEMIYHFNSHDSAKGLGTDMSDPFNRLWMSYFVKTPWFDVDSIGRLYEGFLKIRRDLKNDGLKLSSIVAGKLRGIFIEAHKVDRYRKIFSIRDDEIAIPAENEESIQKLLNAMKIHKGKFVFFIMTKKFPKPQDFPFDRLVKEGFVEGIDFVRGWNYLNLPMNSNPLIQVL